MKMKSLLLAFAPVVLVSAFSSAKAAEAENKPEAGEVVQTQTQIPTTRPPVTANTEAVFSTGVARGRDRLDSATSTSALRQNEIQALGARSLADIIRNIPGIRTESSTGDGNSA
ncbi:MAG TPA: TonB-dependent receptor plug domain-containing protein, partial [Brevundimonas sp.]